MMEEPQDRQDSVRSGERLLGNDGDTFRLMVEKSPIPMAVTDLAGRFVFLNDRFQAVFGYGKADLPDMDAWWQRAYPDARYREEILSVWRDSQGRGFQWDGSGFKNRDYHVTCADGTVRIMKIGGTRIASNNLYLFLDVTARIHAEEEASLLREQLFQAQKMEAIGRLAAGVAHDFNNLLTSIMGYSNLIRLEQGVPEPVREGLAEIEKTALRAADLTKRLLSFSRKRNQQPVVLDLHDLILNLEKMLRRLIGENVTLVSSLRAVGPFLLADPGQIDQVLVNLAVNARDAMPDGGVLTIATRNVPAEEGLGEWIELSVSDTGCGMGPR
jgi:two-component system, cell cycle sensor histidine kinase and response regulator CckA